jgi:hypothetical protein
VKVHALLVPARESVNGEGMAQVVWARTDATLGGLQTAHAIEFAERSARRFDREAAEIHPDE